MDNIRDRLISVFETYGYFLPVSSNDSDINITDFDIPSLDLIAIIIGIEDEFGFNIPDEKISVELFNSLNGLVEFITDILQNRETFD